MAGDGIQNYVDMAAGLTKATRAKATAAAKGLLATAGLEEVAADATDRVAKLADEVLAASRANRELMGKLIASEVDRAAAVLGFVRAEELDDLRRELCRAPDGHGACRRPDRAGDRAGHRALDRPDGALARQQDRRKEDAAKKTAVKKPPAKKRGQLPAGQEGPRQEGHRQEGHGQASHGQEGAREARRPPSRRGQEGAGGRSGRGASEAVPEKPPVTGDAEIDYRDGRGSPARGATGRDHHEVLGRAHEELHRVLQRDRIPPPTERSR